MLWCGPGAGGGELEKPPGPFVWMRVFGGGSQAAALGGAVRAYQFSARAALNIWQHQTAQEEDAALCHAGPLRVWLGELGRGDAGGGEGG